MKKLTIVILSLLSFSIASRAQSGGPTHWLSFVIQAEGRAGGSTPWERVQRLEVSKRVNTVAGQDETAGFIRFEPAYKEVRATFSNFTMDGAWFSPSEVTIEYNEDGRRIGPIKAMPGPGNSDYYQVTLRFRESTARSVLSVRISGRPAGQFIQDTVNTLLLWGKTDEAPANVQVSYLGGDNEMAVRSPYARETTTAYGAYQGRKDAQTGTYAIQLGAYTVLPDSRQFSAVTSFGQVYSRRIGGLNYVRVGPYNDPTLARQYLQQVRSSYPEAYIVMEDGQAQAAATPSGAPYQAPSSYGQPSSYGIPSTPRLPAEPGSIAPRGTQAPSYTLPAGTTGYAIQLASLAQEENAVDFVAELRAKGVSDAYVWKKGDKNRVVVAPFPDKISATNYLATLKRQYSEDGIVVYIAE